MRTESIRNDDTELLTVAKLKNRIDIVEDMIKELAKTPLSDYYTKEQVIEKIEGASGGTTDYDMLSNKPSINGVTLEGNISSDDLGVYQRYTSGDNVNVDNTNDTISAVDTTYLQGANIVIGNENLGDTNNPVYEISATDTTYTGDNTTVVIDANNVVSAINTTYTQGDNININNGVISGVNTTYTQGDNITLTLDNNSSEFSPTYIVSGVDTIVNYQAGSPNVTIENNTISVADSDTDYNSGENITLTLDSNLSTNDRTVYTVNAIDTTYTQGDNITLTLDSNSTEYTPRYEVSGVDTTYTQGDNITLTLDSNSTTTNPIYTVGGVDTTYTQGSNITITQTSNDTLNPVYSISGVDTTYTAGSGIVIDNNNSIFFREKWHKIKTVNLNEFTNIIYINLDDNGDPFLLKKLKLVTLQEVIPETASDSIQIYVGIRDNSDASSISSLPSDCIHITEIYNNEDGRGQYRRMVVDLEYLGNEYGWDGKSYFLLADRIGNEKITFQNPAWRCNTQASLNNRVCNGLLIALADDKAIKTKIELWGVYEQGDNTGVMPVSDMSNYYTKGEINTKITNLNTQLEGILNGE